MDSPDPSPTPKVLSKQNVLRLTLAVAAVTAIIAFYTLGLYRHFRWESLRAHLKEFESFVSVHWFSSAFIFASVYIAVTGLSLPVATWLSLIAGALFGRWWGTCIVSVSATIGATVAFLSSRFLFRGWVESRFRTRLQGLREGLERDGGFYVLLLRLVPLFPFFLVNLGLGVTRVRLTTYVALSWIGMLPATFLFASAGTEIAAIEKPEEILSWRIMLSLTALGIFPLLARWGYHAWKKRARRIDA